MARSSVRDPLLDMISSGSPDVLSYLNLVRSRRIVVFQPTLDQCLLVACDKGSRLYVTYLLQAGADMETRDCHGNTPLLVAATIGHVDIAALLIQHGADVNARNTRGRTALMVASEHGFTSIVSMLLQKMADVNHVDHAGNTSLILSMRRGCPIEVTETLLKQEGVNIEHSNEKGDAALTKALKEMELEKVKILLKGGASLSDVQNIKESNNYNRSECAQDIADKAGIGKVVRLIQKHKSDDSMLLEVVLNRDLTSAKWLMETELVKIKEIIGKDTLLIFKLLSSIDERKSCVTWVEIEMIKLLLSHGLAVDEKGSEVTLAADIGDVRLVEVFCQHGVLVPYQAMVVSAAKGRTDVINLFIKHNVRVNNLDKNNSPVFAGSALESALSNGELECAEILLQNNAKMDVPSALNTVITHRQKECLRMICERYTSACQAAVCSSTSELLLTAASTSDVGVVKVLLELGADVNQLVCGNTALTKSFNLGMVNFLIHRGADVDIDLNDTKSPTVLFKILSTEYFEELKKVLNTNDNTGCFIKRDEIVEDILKHFTRVNVENETGDTALMIAVKMKGTKLILNMLLEAGTFLEHRNRKDETALVLALLANNLDNIQILIGHGAEINTKFKQSTPLICAVEKCDTEMAIVLLNNGADMNAGDADGKTPLMYALENRRNRLVEELIKRGVSVSSRDNDGCMCLMVAARTGDEYVLQSVLNAGGNKDIHRADNAWNTALFYAIIDCRDYNCQNVKILDTLICEGALINHRNNKGMTPLMLAVKFENKKAVLSSGLAEADVNLVSYHNPPKTALSIALSNLPSRPSRMCKIVKHLLDRGAKADLVSPEFVHLLIALGKDSIAQQLIKAGVGPSEVEITKNIKYWFTSSYRLTPFCVALLMNNLFLAEYFIKIVFLTNSDLILLSQSEKVIKYLKQELHTDCANMLKPYSNEPLRLEMMSFVAVSSAIGSHPNRPARVEKTGLPFPLLERLLFLANEELIDERDISDEDLFRKICSCNPKLYNKIKNFDDESRESSDESDNDSTCVIS